MHPTTGHPANAQSSTAAQNHAAQQQPVSSLGAGQNTTGEEQLNALFDLFIKSGLYLRAWSKRTVRTYKQAFASFTQFLDEQRRQEQGTSASSAENKPETPR